MEIRRVRAQNEHIITMTKQDTGGSIAPVPDLSGTGALAITPAMIEAGAAVLETRVFDLGPYSLRHLAEDVFAAMSKACHERSVSG